MQAGITQYVFKRVFFDKLHVATRNASNRRATIVISVNNVMLMNLEDCLGGQGGEGVRRKTVKTKK